MLYNQNESRFTSVISKAEGAPKLDQDSGYGYHREEIRTKKYGAE